MKDIYQVIDTVRLSEKATLLQEQNNEYVLKVARKANKLEIKRAVEQLFGKKVGCCSHMQTTQARRSVNAVADAGRTAHWKKAIVRLKEGETLDLI